MDRFKYKLPDGYKTNKDYEQCYRDTKAVFTQEYYMWNLTNPSEFLQGAKPNFNLTGPFCYAQWYCNYNHQIDHQAGTLEYQTYYEGYRFLSGDSSADESTQITNINPAYLGIIPYLASLGADDSLLPIALIPGALLQIITQLQDPTVLTTVWNSSIASVLSQTNSAILSSVAFQAAAATFGQISEADFFDTTFTAPNGFQGFAYYVVNSIDATADLNISSDAQNQLFSAFTNPTSLGAMATMQGSTIATQYNVTTEQGTLLHSYLVSYVLTSAVVVNGATSIIYAQWANGTAPSFHSGWEAGIPTATGLSFNDVAALFDPSGSCSLTTTMGVHNWLKIQAGAVLADLCPGIFDMSNTQEQLLLTWFNAYASVVVPATLLSTWHLSSWDDFAYAQWGQLITGSSVGSAVGLSYSPEIGALGSFCQFTTSDSIALLNGTYGLFNLTNLESLLSLAQNFSKTFNPSVFNQIRGFWPSIDSSTTLTCLVQNYLLGVISANITTPFLQTNGLVVTRSVKEWLFTGQDQILAGLVGPQNASVGLVGPNVTTTKQPNNTVTHYRIYTGKNDLYWSLMPYTDGTPVPYWNGTETVHGFNGTNFLPNGYLDSDVKEQPLILWHRLIQRQIPFQNKGKTTWAGVDVDVNVRYLTLSDDALQAETVNPHNYLYYSQYNGAINQTSVHSPIPVFLTTPNFLSTDAVFHENITFTDQLWAPTYDATNKYSLHRLSLFILAEPTLGASVWGNLPIQVNLEFQATALFPNLAHGFAPIYWNAIGDKATSKDLQDLNTLYTAGTLWKVMIGVGVGVGVTLIVLGIVGLVYNRKLKGEKI
eukprot:Phypoly_transcript_02550.p1 GENE.Phypoly_transcript_02550~~Phypoly_transcript_02550.p1  ORF type:complete len:885 (+),score=102.85 Phypoly_transcript_02550:186-2657(+)